jgi:maltooligosyltrehalose trehalohydrolase
VSLRVWAPAAGAVELHHDGQRTAMQPTQRGWWEAPIDRARTGLRYGFSLDGGPVRADPRSASLPDGVEGLTELIDHSQFRWSDADWRGIRLPGSVLYELHVGTFTPEGTFDGVTSKLPHLVELGVDAVEVMPIASFPGRRGWGYDGVGLYAPHAAYGGPDGFKRLVDSCHRAGVGVILDVVYNHLGPSGNYLAQFGPYFSDAHHTNWGQGVNLDGPGSDEVRRFFIDNALMWLADYHVDGLRLDAVHALADRSAIHFLEQLAGEVKALSADLGRELWLIAESDLNDPRFVRPPTLGGFGLDAAWADEWHHAWHSVSTGEANGYYEDFGTVQHLAKALRQAWVYDGIWSEHRQRTHGRPPVGLSGERFVVCTQNHDQVGNRAAGERSSALMSEGRLKVAAGLLLTSPFVALMFQGEEWGASTPWQYFTDFPDRRLGRAVTEGRRSEFRSFGWAPEDVPDPQDEATFLRSVLDWSELDDGAHAEILDWYRQLIRLRRDMPDLTDTDLTSTDAWADPECELVVVRRGGLLVTALLGSSGLKLTTGSGRLLIASDPDVELSGEVLHLKPDTLAVLESGDAGGEESSRRTALLPPTKLAAFEWSYD